MGAGLDHAKEPEDDDQKHGHSEQVETHCTHATPPREVHCSVATCHWTRPVSFAWAISVPVPRSWPKARQKRECGRYRRAGATGNAHCHVRLSQGRHHDASQSSNPPLRVRMMTAWLSHYDIRVNESVPPSDRPDRRPTGLEPAGARRSGSRTGSSRAQTPALRGLRPVVLLAGVLMTVGALYLGREFLIPVAVAGLLTFVLNPIVRVFERRLPRAAAVVLVVILTFAVLGAFTLGARDSGRQPGRGDPELPGQPQGQGRADPRGESGWRDREGPVGHEGGRRGAAEGGQAGQACREAGARRGEVPGRGLLAASSRPGCARQRRAWCSCW